MVTVSVLLLLLSASTPPVHSRLSTFHVIQGYWNQTEAQEACRENDTDLVTVYSDEDNTELFSMMNMSGIPYGWIGLHRGEFSVKWSNGDPVNFRTLSGDCGTSACCAALKSDGSWESLKCTVRKYFMCYEQDASSQTPNYHLIVENKTWYEAQSYCRQKYTDLVSIRAQQHNDEVRIKGLNSSTSFWIGLLRDHWQWSDGENAAYRNWSELEPQLYDCVVLTNGRWSAHECDHKHTPLCYNTSLHVSDEALSWEKALGYCHEKNRAGILIIHSQKEQEEVESELLRRRITSESLWVGFGPNRLSELKVSSSPLTCEDVKRLTEAHTHTAEAAPNYVMYSTKLRVVCNLK